MKVKKLIIVLVSTLLAAATLCSCAYPAKIISAVLSPKSDASDKTNTSEAAAENYMDAAEHWVSAYLCNYAHREYSAGEDVGDINLLYLGAMYCLANAKELDGVITAGDDPYPTSVSITGVQMEKVCKNLISSDFSLTDYHSTLVTDKYYSGDDLYVFYTGRDYWNGDNYNATTAKARAVENGKIAVDACTYHYSSVGLADNFRMLEYLVEPIEDDGCLYFKLHGITDNGSAENLENDAIVSFNGYQNLNDLTYLYDGVDWDKRPTIAEATLRVPMKYKVITDEITSFESDGDGSGSFVRYMQFELIKVDKDYVLTHDIHDLRTTDEMRKYKDSDEVAVMWRFYDDYERASGKSAAGYDYISYYKEYAGDNGEEGLLEQRYYRVSDEYVLGVYYGAEDETLGIAQTALDGMTFEVK